MNCKPLLFSIFTIVSGCMGDPQTETGSNKTEPDFNTCLGFSSPSANIVVLDAKSGSIIDSASVTVDLIGASSTKSLVANYINGDDHLGNSDPNAYYTLLEMNERNFLIHFSVVAKGYVEYSSEDYEFVLHTSCGAKNSFNYTVHLCPVGASCP